MIGHKQVEVDELTRWLEEGRPLTVLDVRPSEQRKDWYIPGSLHEDLYERIKLEGPAAVDQLELPTDRPVVTVCAAGHTSQAAAAGLAARGFETYSLVGGMKAWGTAWNTASLKLGSGVEVLQVRRIGKGCLSYLVIAGSEAVVIDAALDPTVFIELAKERGAEIVAVLDTHIHADHISRSRPLSESLGVPLRLPAQERASFPFEPIGEGESVTVGSVQLKALHTPGHTWESTSYLLPGEAIFTGDTLFVDGVGRPDLEARTREAEKRASALHASLQRLLRLPGDLMVLPGHSSGPLEFDSEVWGATLATVRSRSSLLGLDEPAFVTHVTSHLPPTPENHSRIVELNETGEAAEDAGTLEAGGNRCAVG